MQERADGLQKVAATGDTQQLPPGAAIGIAIGAQIAPPHPAPIRTVRVWAEMGGGVDLASSPPRGHEARGRGASEWRSLACAQASQCGFLVRPAKGVIARWRLGTGGVGSGAVG